MSRGSRAPDPDARVARRPRGPQPGQRLRRSQRDRRIAGIAGGMGAFLNTSPTLLRWMFALSLLPSLGVTGVGYLLLWALLPPEPS